MIDRRESKLEASIGLSRKWDAREAGREVAKSTIKDLSQPPSFFLLFSTIHYKDHGGFQEFLDGVWDVLPEGTPLIGGTVAAFINNYGCYSRGAAALAVSYPNLDIAVGIGRYSRRNPKKAAENCANMIKRGLKESKYKNKMLVNMISAGKLPKFPIVGRIQIIKSKFFGWIATYFGMKLFPLIGYGLGKEEDVIDHLVSYMSDYYIIGGSALDSGDMLENYQFIGNNVYTNSIVALGCSVDLQIFLRSMIRLHETDKSLEITSATRDGRVIKKLDNKPAKEQILKALGVREEQFKDLGPFYYRTSNYFPVTFEENKKYTTGVGGFFGDNIYLGYKTRGKKMILLSITGREIIDLIDNSFRDLDKNKFPFIFMYLSFILVNTLGARTYIIKSKLDEYIKEIPYLMICPVNENAGTPNEPAIARVYSFNALSLLTK